MSSVVCVAGGIQEGLVGEGLVLGGRGGFTRKRARRWCPHVWRRLLRASSSGPGPQDRWRSRPRCCQA